MPSCPVVLALRCASLRCRAAASLWPSVHVCALACSLTRSRCPAATRCAPAQSLTGHQSGVECVTFDAAEEVVVAGAAGGTIKMWDLAAAKGAARRGTRAPAAP
jgi:WD40 repeat protein